MSKGLLDTLQGKGHDLIDQYEQEEMVRKTAKKPARPVVNHAQDVVEAIGTGAGAAVQDAGNLVKKAGKKIGSKYHDALYKSEMKRREGIDNLEKIGSTISGEVSRFGRDLSKAAGDAKEWMDENPAFLMGATPVLLGFLTGDTEGGYAMGSKVMFDEAGRRDEWAKKEWDAKQKRLLAGAKEKGTKTQMKSMYNKETGEETPFVYDPIKQTLVHAETGEPFTSEKYATDIPLETKREINDLADIRLFTAKGQNFTYKKGEDGRLYEVDKMDRGRKPRMVFNPQGLSPTQRIAGKEAAAKYNKIAQPQIESIRDLETSWKDLSSKNQLANKLAIMRFVKEVETRLSDYDRLYYTQEIADVEKFEERYRKLDDNAINPRLKKDGFALAARMLAKAKRKISDARKTGGSQLKGLHKDFPTDRLDGVFGDVPEFANGAWMIHPETKQKAKIDWEDVQDHLDKGFKVMP